MDSISRRDSINFMQNIYGKLESREKEFETFSAKVKVAFQGGDGKRNDFNAFIRLQKDSVLWVSINALLGIEAFRVLITPDSVKVLDKMDRTLQLRSVNYLQEITKLPFSFKELQDLIVGNPVYFDNQVVSYKREGVSVSILNIGPIFKHLLTLDSSEYKILHSKLDDVNAISARTADITYGEYENINGTLFSTYRRITISEKSKLDIEMKFKQYGFNEPLNFPFNIPKNYKLQ